MPNDAGNTLRDAFFDLSQPALLERMRAEKFFHDMEIAGARTGSWVYDGGYPPNYHLWPVFQYLGELDLAGRRCLDIGAFDGMTAFVMAEHGAAHVDATCQYDLDRFRIVRALKRYARVAYHPKTDLAAIAQRFAGAQYDVAVISAMLHHLTAPLDGLLETRRLLRQGGMFILESIFLDEAAPALYLNTELDDPIYGAPTLFVPTLPALRGMLRFAGFDLLSETRLLGGRAARERNYERVTFLARAVKPSQIRGRSEKAAEIHGKSLTLGPISFPALEADESAPSTIAYAGPEGARTLNIWIDRVDAPLQPRMRAAPPDVRPMFAAARENRFLQLAAEGPNDAFTWDDVYLLGARYPGETMPDGMAWGLKQFGNLHVLDYVRRLGLSRVLEVGPGFNLYFVNHLPAWCSYVGLDASGFYDENVMAMANKARANVTSIDALLGATGGVIEQDIFDACISVSVLEHVPPADVAKVCHDMFRVLRPGGWALHSIDAKASSLSKVGARWLKHLREAGFRLEDSDVESTLGGALAAPENDPPFHEPLSIRTRFAQGYRRSIWGDRTLTPSQSHSTTILVAAQKPAHD